MSVARGDALVLFGATGDLARKQIFPALYRLAARGRLDCPVVGVAATAWRHDQLRDHARAAVERAVPDADEAALAAFLAQLAMVSGDYRDPEAFRTLATRLAEAGPGTRSTTSPSRPACSRPSSTASPASDCTEMPAW